MTMAFLLALVVVLSTTMTTITTTASATATPAVMTTTGSGSGSSSSGSSSNTENPFDYYEFELILRPRSGDGWPGNADDNNNNNNNNRCRQPTPAAFLTAFEALGQLPNGTFVGVLRLFDTIVIRVNTSADPTRNATTVASNYVDAINNNTSSSSGGSSSSSSSSAAVSPADARAAAGLAQRCGVVSAVFGYSPVVIPPYLREPYTPTSTPYIVMGSLAAGLIVAQLVYGYSHFKSFGFIRPRDEDERD